MSRLLTFLMSNCNCLISATRVGEPNGLVMPHMRSSPSHDGRGDADGGGAVLVDTGEAGEGALRDGEEGEPGSAKSSNYNSDDESMKIIDAVIGDPGGLQEQYGKKGKNAKKASVVVKGQSEFDHQAIKASFYWAFTHGNKERKPNYGTCDHRQESVIQSFHRRFPFLSQYFSSYRPSSGRFVPVLYPAMRYEVRTIGVDVFFVQTPKDRERCFRFCQQKNAVSIDTEAAPLNSNIDLVQIGDKDQVFLCPLRNQDPEFLNAVAKAIFHDACKTVYQFGSDDVAKFLRTIGNRMDIVCTLVDVQERLREQARLPPGRPLSLVDAVKARYGIDRVLSKAWTISGWDNIPLYRDQLEYAALDAVFAFLLGSELK